MKSEIAIFVNDVDILSALATADQLSVLTCKPGSKLYLHFPTFSHANFLTFCRVRQFVLRNFRQVEIVGQDDCTFGEKDSSANDLVAAHRTLLEQNVSRTVWPRQASNTDELIVVCLDVHETAEHLDDHAHHLNLIMPIPNPPKVVTLAGFKQLLASEGVSHFSIPAPVSTRSRESNAQSVNGYETSWQNPPDDGVRQLYDDADLEGMFNTLRLQPTEVRHSLRRNLDLLKELGSSRTYALAPTLSALDSLRDRFPNFGEVINAIARGIALARLAQYPMAHAQPILLLGKPGIGKTMFGKALAETFQTDFFEIRMNSLTAGFTIGGNDLSWSNGRPGILFNKVALGRFINPVALLDEIDKVSSDRQYDPLAHFYALLESDTAKRFQDEAIPLKIDLSHVTWVATANDATAIDAPLLSRFSVFDIPSPTGSQARTIVQNMYLSLLERESWGSHFERLLSEEAMDMVTTAPPREARKLLVDALGNAAIANRKTVLGSDFNRQRINGTRVRHPGFY